MPSLTRGPALVGLRGRPVQGLLGGGVAGESVLDLVASCLGRKTKTMGLSSPASAAAFFTADSLADHSSRIHTGTSPSSTDGFVLPPVDVELAGGLARAVGELQAAEGGLDGGDEPLAAELVHASGVVADGGEAAAVVLLPLGVLFGLEPVVVVDPARCVRRRRARRAARARAFGAGRRPRRGPRRGGRRGTARSPAAQSRHRGTGCDICEMRKIRAHSRALTRRRRPRSSSAG